MAIHPLVEIQTLPKTTTIYCEVDVPHDGTCLFYSLVFSVLLPILNDAEQFHDLFNKLFDEDNFTESTEESLKDLLWQYDGNPNFVIQHKGADFLKRLVDIDFRQKLVAYMCKEKARFSAVAFTDEKEDFDVNMISMKKLRTWGGHREIEAASDFLQKRIVLYEKFKGQLTERAIYGDEKYSNTIYLIRLDNHYHYLLAPCYFGTVQYFAKQRLSSLPQPEQNQLLRLQKLINQTTPLRQATHLNNIIIDYLRSSSQPLQQNNHPHFFQVFESKAEQENSRLLPAILLSNEERMVYRNQSSLSYAELNEQANQLAHFLLNIKAKSNSTDNFVVGLFFYQSVEYVVSVLALMKVGIAFTPLSANTEIATQRLISYAQGAGVKLLLTHSSLKTRDFLTTEQIQKINSIVFLDEAKLDITSCSKANPKTVVSPDQLAYVLSTSGSTGKPKQVLIKYRGLYNCMRAHIDLLELSEKDCVAAFADIAFDAHLIEIMMTLGAGACLCPIPHVKRLDLTKLPYFYKEHAITVSIFTPSMLTQLKRRSFHDKLRVIISTGEKVTKEIVRDWQPTDLPQILFINGYGPAEATIATSMAILRPDDEIHIGKSILGLRMLVLEQEPQIKDKPQKVKPDIEGEIYITGEGLGDYKDSILADERFYEIDDPDNPEQRIRIFRTRDAAVIDEKNRVLIKKRLDRQVKIHGKLIYPDEIETTLEAYRDEKSISVIKKACVDVEVIPTDDIPRFTAYLIQDPNNPPVNPRDLYYYLVNQQTALMVPARWGSIDTTQFNPSGKTDFNKLRTFQTRYLQGPSGVKISDLKSEDQLEEKLATLWNTILHIDDKNLVFQVDDSFLQLGATSLQCANLLTELRNDPFHLGLSMEEFLRSPTIATLARKIRKRGNELPEIVSLADEKATADVTPLFLVHTLLGDPREDYRKINNNQYWPSRRPIYAVKVRERFDLNIIEDSLEMMALDYLQAIKNIQPRGPYLLGGWSAGGVIAFVIATILRSKGEEVGVVMIDSEAPATYQKKSNGEYADFLLDLYDKKLKKGNVGVVARETLIQKPKEEQVYLFFNVLVKKHIEKVKQSAQLSTDNLVMDHKISQLINIRNILISVLRYRTNMVMHDITLFAATQTQVKLHSNKRLGWPETVTFEKLISIPGNHESIIVGDDSAAKGLAKLLDEWCVAQSKKFELKAISMDFSQLATQLKQRYEEDSEYIRIISSTKVISLNELYVDLAIVPEEKEVKQNINTENKQATTEITATPNIPQSLPFTATTGGAVGIVVDTTIRVATGDKESTSQKIHRIQQQMWLNEENDYELDRFTIIKPEDIFAQDNAPKKVLVAGQAGIGKTTFCRYIIFCWKKINERNLWHEHFDWIFLVPLKKLNNKELNKKIWREYILSINSLTPDEERIFWLHVEKNPQRILYLLDGYDETTDKVKEFIEHEVLMKFDVRVIITTRPYSIDARINSHVKDMRLQIAGFKDSSVVEAYVQKYFHKSPALAGELIKLLKENNNISRIAYIPLILSLICVLYEIKKYHTFKKFTKTDLYHEIAMRLLRNSLQQPKGDYTEEEIRVRTDNGILRLALTKQQTNMPNVASALRYMELLAFRAMSNEHTLLPSALPSRCFEEFIKQEAKRDEKTLSGVNDAVVIETVLSLSFLQQVSNKKSMEATIWNRDIEFLHRSLQEFFAARYVKNCLQFGTDGKPFVLSGTVKEELAKIKYDPHYRNVWPFVAGLFAIDDDSKHLLPTFFAWLENDMPNDLVGYGNVCLILRCLEEVREENLQSEAMQNLIAWLDEAVFYSLLFTARMEELAGYLKLCPNYLARSKLINKLLDQLQHQEAHIKENIKQALKELKQLWVNDDGVTKKLLQFYQSIWDEKLKAHAKEIILDAGMLLLESLKRLQKNHGGDLAILQVDIKNFIDQIIQADQRKMGNKLSVQPLSDAKQVLQRRDCLMNSFAALEHPKQWPFDRLKTVLGLTRPDPNKALASAAYEISMQNYEGIKNSMIVRREMIITSIAKYTDRFAELKSDDKKYFIGIILNFINNSKYQIHIHDLTALLKQLTLKDNLLLTEIIRCLLTFTTKQYSWLVRKDSWEALIRLRKKNMLEWMQVLSDKSLTASLEQALIATVNDPDREVHLTGIKAVDHLSVSIPILETKLIGFLKNKQTQDLSWVIALLIPLIGNVKIIEHLVDCLAWAGIGEGLIAIRNYLKNRSAELDKTLISAWREYTKHSRKNFLDELLRLFECSTPIEKLVILEILQEVIHKESQYITITERESIVKFFLNTIKNEEENDDIKIVLIEMLTGSKLIQQDILLALLQMRFFSGTDKRLLWIIDRAFTAYFIQDLSREESMEEDSKEFLDRILVFGYFIMLVSKLKIKQLLDIVASKKNISPYIYQELLKITIKKVIRSDIVVYIADNQLVIHYDTQSYKLRVDTVELRLLVRQQLTELRLMHVIYAGYTVLAERLLQQNLDPDDMTPNGQSPFFLTICRAHAEQKNSSLQTKYSTLITALQHKRTKANVDKKTEITTTAAAANLDAKNTKGFIPRRQNAFSARANPSRQPVESDEMTSLKMTAQIYSLADKKRNYPQEQKILNSALGLNKENVFALCMLGNLLRSQGRYREAQDNFETALGLVRNENYLQCYLGIAGVLTAQGEYAGAREKYTQALPYAFDQSDIYSQMGLTFVYEGEYAKGLQYCELALAMDDKHIQARGFKAYLLIHIKEFASACKLLMELDVEIKADHPQRAWVLNLWGCIYYSQGHNVGGSLSDGYHRDALKFLKDALALDDPNCKQMILANMALAHIELEEYSTALECATKALEDNRYYGTALIVKHFVTFKMAKTNDLNDLNKGFEEIRVINPNNAELYYYWAKACCVQHNTKQALIYLELILKKINPQYQAALNLKRSLERCSVDEDDEFENVLTR